MAIAVKLIEKLIGLTKWAFSNAKERAEVKDKISVHGYDDARLDALIALNTKMDTKYQEQQEKRANQIMATRNFEEKYSNERMHCRHLRMLVKKVLDEKEYEKYERLLGLDENLKKALEPFDEQARKLYTHCKNDPLLMERLAKFAITPEKIQERLDGLEELKQLNKEQETAKGLSQAARKERDDVYRELKKEWSDFKYICRIAFEGADNPQYKELVGIVEYSEGYVRTKEEETPAQEPQEPQELQELQEPQMN